VCEASGMVPQLQRIADPFGIGVHSSRRGRAAAGSSPTVVMGGSNVPERRRIGASY